MDRWQKETLNLQVGDTIVWRDEAIEVEGQPVEAGMKGEVISLHDSFGERHYQLGLLWLTTPAEPLLQRRSDFVGILVERVAPEPKCFAAIGQEIDSISLQLTLDPRTA